MGFGCSFSDCFRCFDRCRLRRGGRLFWSALVGLFVRWRRLSDGNDWRLLFVDLGEHDGPGRRFVAAAAGGFVEAEGLQSSCKSKEEQGGSDEDTGVEM